MCDWLILFSVKREFKKLLFGIRDLKVLREPWRTWIINRYSQFYHVTALRDFDKRVLPMIRVVYREWFAIWSLDLASHDFAFFKHCFSRNNRSSKWVSYLFSWFGKTKFLHPWFAILSFFRSWTVPKTPLCDTLSTTKIACTLLHEIFATR